LETLAFLVGAALFADAMEFRLDHFYRINRRALIWATILFLIYIMRDFFALVFLTFLLVSFTLPVIDYFQRHTHLPRTLIIVALYLLILIGLSGWVYYVVPRVIKEATTVAGELENIQQSILGMRDKLSQQYPGLAPLFDRLEKQDLERMLAQLSGEVRPILQTSAKLAFAAVSTILLSLLFSFLIVLDLTRLTRELKRLERSRLHDFYHESAEPVVRFASVLARSFRAQAMIAVVNTVLTLIGFWILGLKNALLLGTIVFFFSFIPVLGVFISTTPAVLVALNQQGLKLAILVVVLVTIIHLIEAYVLNPMIYGHHLKLNPVFVLIILFVGHHFFGLWGMLLGVPVSYYFLHYVFGVPIELAETDAQDQIGSSAGS
jgi:predicted PurR-regulated permease PerM